MSHTPHELAEEFPDKIEAMSALKQSDAHFARLADEYHEINRAVHRALTGLGGLEVLGFVDDLPERMAAADVVVTKAGPSTLAEAGAVGTPLVVYAHMPGQEVGNLDWVRARGWGRVALDLDRVPSAVMAWLDDADARRELRTRAREAADQPPASARIAALVLEEARSVRASLHRCASSTTFREPRHEPA